jgi:hypothetical protein
MGMYDTVNVEINCPYCNALIKAGSFQTKDLGCDLDVVDAVDVSTFYTSCDKCHSWIEFSKDEKTLSQVRPTPYDLDEIFAMGFKFSRREIDKSKELHPLFLTKAFGTRLMTEDELKRTMF